ncbi:hypothetical protein SPFM8_00176 [Salmonella phage SPFM8]|nr:hypothetical protein SPFM8_00176 [Salmonella phage SPFM8]
MWLLENGWLPESYVYGIQSELPVGDELVYTYHQYTGFTAEGVVTLSREEFGLLMHCDSYKLTVLSHRGQRWVIGGCTSSIYSTLVMGGRLMSWRSSVSSLFDSKKAFLDWVRMLYGINYRKINTSVPSHDEDFCGEMHFTRSEGDEYARMGFCCETDAQLTSLADALLRSAGCNYAIVLCLDHGYMLEVINMVRALRRLYYRIFEVFSRDTVAPDAEDRKALSLLNDIDPSTLQDEGENMLRVIERTERILDRTWLFPSIEGLEYRVITHHYTLAYLHLAGQKGKKVNMGVAIEHDCQTFDPIAYSVEFLKHYHAIPFSLMLYKEFPKSIITEQFWMLGELANGFVSAFVGLHGQKQTQDVCYLMRPTLKDAGTRDPKYGFTSDPSVVPLETLSLEALYQRLGFEAVTKRVEITVRRLLEVQMLDITCFPHDTEHAYIYELHVLSEPLFHEWKRLTLSNSGRAQMYFRGCRSGIVYRERIQDLRPVADQEDDHWLVMDKNDLTVEFSGRLTTLGQLVTELIGTL